MAWRREDAKKCDRPGSWVAVTMNFSLIAWAVVLMQRFGIANQFVAFTVLYVLTSIIPLFTQIHSLLREMPHRVRAVVQLIGFGSLATLLGALDFITNFPLWHPFLVISLVSSLAVCFSSPLGRSLSRCFDIAIFPKTYWQYALAILASVLGLVTWQYSHAAFSVVVSLNIHFY